MKKVIIAFEGTHFSDGAFEFVSKLNEIKPILLTGVFIPQAYLINLWSFADGMIGNAYSPLLESEESKLVQENIDRFEKLCKSNDIDYRVHKDFLDLALPELKKESRFADLLILSNEIFYENLGYGMPNEYLKEVLHEMECPVVVVPEKHNFLNNIILAYDGSEESVFAIKQFAYLFPEFANNETILVYADDDVSKDFPDKIQIEELSARHFKNLVLTKLDIDPKKFFATWVSEKKSALLVSGSFGRSGFSQLFRKSFVRDIITDNKLPVFIAHK